MCRVPHPTWLLPILFPAATPSFPFPFLSLSFFSGSSNTAAGDGEVGLGGSHTEDGGSGAAAGWWRQWRPASGDDGLFIFLWFLKVFAECPFNTHSKLFVVHEKKPTAKLALPAGVCRERFVVCGTQQSFCRVHYGLCRVHPAHGKYAESGSERSSADKVACGGTCSILGFNRWYSFSGRRHARR